MDIAITLHGPAPEAAVPDWGHLRVRLAAAHSARREGRDAMGALPGAFGGFANWHAGLARGHGSWGVNPNDSADGKFTAGIESRVAADFEAGGRGQ